MNKIFQCILNKFPTAGLKKTTNLNKLRGFRKKLKGSWEKLNLSFFGFKTQRTDSEQIHLKVLKKVLSNE